MALRAFHLPLHRAASSDSSSLPSAQDHVPPHPFHRPVKVNLYLDAVYPGDGSLELIPGTHHPELAADILKRLGYYAELPDVRPAVAVGGGPRLRDAVADHVPKVAPELHPGDAIIFRASSQRPCILRQLLSSRLCADNHMWHRAAIYKSRAPRRSITLQYHRDPQDDVVEQRHLREIIAQTQEHWTGDAELQPKGSRFHAVGTAPGTTSHLFSEMLLAHGGPSVAKMARRYEEMGVPRVRVGGADDEAPAPPPGTGRDGGGFPAPRL